MLAALLIAGSITPMSRAEDPDYFTQQGTWAATPPCFPAGAHSKPSRAGLAGGDDPVAAPDLGARAFTISLWIRTEEAGGALFSRSPLEDAWRPGSKAFFLREGRPTYDVGLGERRDHGDRGKRREMAPPGPHGPGRDSTSTWMVPAWAAGPIEISGTTPGGSGQRERCAEDRRRCGRTSPRAGPSKVSSTRCSSTAGP